MSAFHWANVSGSTATSAAMKGLASPTIRPWLISQWARSRSSSTAGATFLPAAVMMRSFFRPVMARNPSSSRAPVSPVCSQPSSSIISRVALSLFQ